MKKFFSLQKLKLNPFKGFNFNSSKKEYKAKWEEIIDLKVNSLEDVKVKTDDLTENKKFFPALIHIYKAIDKLKLKNPKEVSKLTEEDMAIYKAIQEQKVKIINQIKEDSFFKSYFGIQQFNNIIWSKNETTSGWKIVLIVALVAIIFVEVIYTNFRQLSPFLLNSDERANDFFFFGQKKQNQPFKLAENVEDRLSDVKGIDEVREEIEEVVKMLKDPQKYESAGAKLLRGILLIGKPGTGKTLLARALAGESGVNFIYVASSEFDKSLVGMGNKLVKKLFQMARENQPCIIFIDEIDTLLHSGRRSGKNSTSFERGLINTFLAEMDGFQKRDHIFVMGATNSEKDLDKAALRPGRFDKIIHVPLPDKIGRRDIFDLYLKKIKMPLKEISSDSLSQMTPGFTGAEIENMINTAIIGAVDVDKKYLSKEDFEDARDRVVLGIKRRIKEKNNVRSLLQTAVHEAGHTLVCYKDKFCKNGIHKVTIVPRGDSKGKTSTLIDDIEGTKEEFISMIDMSLAGLIAEELYFGSEKVSVGCGNDLSRATNLAKSMVKLYAMDNGFGYMVVEDDYIVSHRISGNTRNSLDVSVDNILKQRTAIVKEILKTNIGELKTLSQKLVEYEELNKSDIDNILTGQEPDRTDTKSKKRDLIPGAFAI